LLRLITQTEAVARHGLMSNRTPPGTRESSSRRSAIGRAERCGDDGRWAESRTPFIPTARSTFIIPDAAGFRIAVLDTYSNNHIPTCARVVDDICEVTGSMSRPSLRGVSKTPRCHRQSGRSRLFLSTRSKRACCCLSLSYGGSKGSCVCTSWVLCSSRYLRYLSRYSGTKVNIS
jgi:hypothetical protein